MAKYMFEVIVNSIKYLTQNLPYYNSSAAAVAVPAVIGGAFVAITTEACNQYNSHGLSSEFAMPAAAATVAGAMLLGAVERTVEHFFDSGE